MSPNLHILKKIKTFDSETSPNLHILKKIKNFRLYVGLTGIDELVFVFVFFFYFFLSICRFGGFSLSFFFDFCEYMQVVCTFGIKMLMFF